MPINDPTLQKSHLWLQIHLIWINVILISFFVPPVFSHDHPYVNREAVVDQLEFANKLFQENAFNLAELEYNRFIYLFPDHPQIRFAISQKGMCFFKQKKYQQAIRTFEDIITQKEMDKLKINAFFQSSNCYVHLNQHQKAIQILIDLTGITSDEEVLNNAFYRIGWIYIELGAWRLAKQYFSYMRGADNLVLQSQHVTDVINDHLPIPAKSPTVASMLGVFPGMGYVYANRYQDAAVAFIINALCIGLAYESFDNELPVLGSAFTFVGTGFYFASIYGSINSVYKYNHAVKRKTIDHILNQFTLSQEDNF